MSEASNGTYTIHILGKKYEVPAGLTIMKSIEYAGYRLTHGCGCRGGVCGACATIYRMENDTKWHICLACQTNAADGMHLVQLPYVPSYRASSDVTKEECTPETVARFYPTLKRCMGCNTCTNTCPISLPVLDYVSAIIQGDFETARELSIECISCGMCAARCPGELAPMNMALMVRRLMGRAAHKNTPEFQQRLTDIRNDKFKAEITKYKGMTKEDLQVVYKEFQSTKGASV